MAKRSYKDDIIDRQNEKIKELEAQIYGDWLGRRLKQEYSKIKAAKAAGDEEAVHMHLEVIAVLDEKGMIPLDEDINPMYRTVRDLDLSVRLYNCLMRAGIVEMAQMINMTFNDYMHVRNLGKKCYLELKDKLSRFGFELEEVPEED